MSVRLAIVILLLVQLAVTVAVRPAGDFPLNDDWAYAHSVLWLLDENRIRLSNWIAMNLLPQTLAGGLVSAAFGFSFSNLRHLTQVVALLTSIASMYWFLACGLRTSHALVACLALIAMPCWPILANSYMSDIYGLALALPAATLFLTSLTEARRWKLVLASLLACAGVLERQVVMVVPLAFAVAWLWQHRKWTPGNLITGLAPALVAVAAQAAYRLYLSHGPGIPAAQQFVHGRVLNMALDILTGEGIMREWAASNALCILGYLGLFFVGWAAWWGMTGASRPARACLIAAGTAIVCSVLYLGWLPPYRPNNIIDATGIGPYTLYDGLAHPVAALDRSRGTFWRIAGITAAMGATAVVALLLATISHLCKNRREASPARVFMLTLMLAYLLPFVITDFFDRYLLFVLPPLFSLWAMTWAPRTRPLGGWPQAAGAAWICATLSVSAAATHDYFAWNRARWNAIRTAEQLGATSATLDGGFEYNGFANFEAKPKASRDGVSWWWVEDDEYVVAFSVRPGYRVLKTFKVSRWLDRTPAEIHLLRRIEQLTDSRPVGLPGSAAIESIAANPHPGDPLRKRSTALSSHAQV